MRYDVIVVGVGPAGSTVARECAAHGLSVLVLDKAVFPRDKPCGGGINIRTARLLPFDLAPVAERKIAGIRFTWRRLQQLIHFYGFEPLHMWELRSHRLPIRRPDSALSNGNVLLVGDAAGLVDPFTGEGIYAAIWSGTIAANHLLDYLDGRAPDLRGYRHQVEHELIPELAAAPRFAELYRCIPSLCTELVRRSSRAWKHGTRLVRGDQSYTHLLQELSALGRGIELFSDILRTIPGLQRRIGLEGVRRPERFFTQASN